MSMRSLARRLFRKPVSPCAPDHDPRLRPRFRLDILTLEDRNAPGSLLGELLAAGGGGADPLGWLIGSSTLQADAPEKPQTISIRAERPAEEQSAPPIVLAGESQTQRDEQAGNGGLQSLPSVSVRLSLDDDLMFLPAATAIPSSAIIGARGMSEPRGAGTVEPSSSRSVATGGISSAMPEASDTGARFILRPNAIPASQSNVTGEVVQTAYSAAFGISAEVIAQLPPPMDPVANNDATTVGEDGVVVIDVMANDTGEPGALRIDSWDSQPAHGTVTQETAGKLTYTPFPDFNGTDTFTYVATDGQSTSNTATVTVTVISSNDAPVAFNDAFAFSHANNAFDPSTITFGSGWLLSNDIDFDGFGSLSIAAVDTASLGTVGTIAMNSFAGEFTWSGPKDFFGATEFRYKTQDAGGAMSDWATVQLWANPFGLLDPMDPNSAAYYQPIANPDRMAAGDEPVTANVMANDANGTVAVLAYPPVSGRVTGFGLDGSVTYLPGVAHADTSFTYVLFGPNGVLTTTTTVAAVTVNLEIYNGQGGAAVKEENETKIGAFTVVNINDTDGAFGRDSDQGNTGVIAGQLQANGQPAPGKDEVDLMKLVVYKPAGMVAGEGVLVTATGPAKFFQSSKRETNHANPLSLGFDYFVENGQPVAFKTFWVEIYETSNDLRAVTIEMKYTYDTNKVATDTVKATGVWAEFDNKTGFRANGQKGPSDDADDEPYRAHFKGYTANPLFELGTPPQTDYQLYPGTENAGPWVILNNAMEMVFTTRPAGIGKEAGGSIRFDISRTIETISGFQVGKSFTGPDPIGFPSFRENANDDLSAGDEDNKPHDSTGRIFSFDAPGGFYKVLPVPGPSGGASRYTHRMNAHEFVRVKLDGSNIHSPSGNGVIGSRSSELVDWRSWSDFTWDGKAWVRVPNTADYVYNEMALGAARKLT